MSDQFLFGVFPYLAAALAIGGTVYRYRTSAQGITSRSSQLLEGRLLFWGSLPWHYAIVLVLLAHILAALFPGAWGALLGSPGRLVVLEVTGSARPTRASSYTIHTVTIAPVNAASGMANIPTRHRTAWSVWQTSRPGCSVPAAT